MNTDTKTAKEWNYKSPTYWLVAGAGAFITGLGINGMLRPGPAAHSFGLPNQDPQDYGYVRVKADRDLFTGIVVFALLTLRHKAALQVLILLSSLQPLIDGLLVLFSSKLSAKEKASRIAIHASALVYTFVTGLLLRK
jgi:hypothetical protein